MKAKSGTKTVEATGPEQNKTEVAPSTLPGLTAASTAEGTMQYGKKREHVAEAARTQITALATDAEMPRPPRHLWGRNIGKCPCCCQSIPASEINDPDRWR
jgi:hypothetical protein